MAWTTPRTWIPGEKVTADMLNVHLRDNLNELSLASIVTSAPSAAIGTQHNFDPGIVGNTIIYVNSAAALTITGLSAGVASQRVRIVNVGLFPVFLSPENTGSTTTGRLWNFVTSGPTPIGPAVAGSAGVPGTQGFAEYVYHLTSSRWRLVAHEQGSWITPTFAAGDWTGSGGVTAWTVEPGDVVADRYLVTGRRLLFNIRLLTTTITGTGTEIRRAMYGYTGPTIGPVGLADVFDGSPAVNTGAIYFGNNALISFHRRLIGSATAPNWTAVTNLMSINASGFMELT